MNIGKSRLLAGLLNLLCPGLGHIYWKEITFGVFVFLVGIIAVVLWTVVQFVELPLWAVVILFSLPLIFYLFTFVDLFGAMARRDSKWQITWKRLLIFVLIGILYQVLVPLAPVNFAIRNAPEIYAMEDNSLNPLYSEGDLMKASTYAYEVNFFFLDQPIVRSFPGRYDIVRFTTSSGRRHTAMVIGLPDEDIEIGGGLMVVNGLPQLDRKANQLTFGADWPLTSVNSYSILVARMKFGVVDEIYQVPLIDICGKVSRLW